MHSHSCKSQDTDSRQAALFPPFIFCFPVRQKASSVHLSALQPITVRWRLLWVGTDERRSDPESALSARTGGCAGHQRRLGQEAAGMEIRPDRFKASAAKTLGKINRYAAFFGVTPPTFSLSFYALVPLVLSVHCAAVSHSPSSQKRPFVEVSSFLSFLPLRTRWEVGKKTLKLWIFRHKHHGCIKKSRSCAVCGVHGRVSVADERC